MSAVESGGEAQARCTTCTTPKNRVLQGPPGGRVREAAAREGTEPPGPMHKAQSTHSSQEQLQEFCIRTLDAIGLTASRGRSDHLTLHAKPRSTAKRG